MKRDMEKKSCNINEKFLSYDQFGQPYELKIGEKRSALPSKMGSFCSILLLVVLFAYAGYKASILEGKKKVDIVQAVQENYFDDSYVFGAEQGLNLAVALRF